MKVANTHYRTIWYEPQTSCVKIIDQTRLPHEFIIRELQSLSDAALAISSMQVRGAPLIGATAAFGVVLAMQEAPTDQHLDTALQTLLATRPTAINLRWALNQMDVCLRRADESSRLDLAMQLAAELCDADVRNCEAIGSHGYELFKTLIPRSGDSLQLMTHCNAGWLATVDWGTALAPIYKAHDAGMKVHVWVSETRPRNQGASLTAWELSAHGVPHTLIADNAAGHLMQKGLVDACIVGTDRTLQNGTVCNKVGTYLKALAANHNQVPFYVAAPSSSIQWNGALHGDDIPIEQRESAELTFMTGRMANKAMAEVALLGGLETRVRNDAFDVSPPELITALVTERGVCEASEAGLARFFPDKLGSDAK